MMITTMLFAALVANPEAFVFRDADTGEVIDPAAIEVGSGDVRFITVGR